MGFQTLNPQGAYYIMADFSELDFADDQAAMDFFLEKAKVATVTGRSFYLNPEDGYKQLRICYALREEKVQNAIEAMQAVLAD